MFGNARPWDDCQSKTGTPEFTALGMRAWASAYGPVYMCAYGCIWQSVKKIERDLENNL